MFDISDICASMRCPAIFLCLACCIIAIFQRKDAEPQRLKSDAPLPPPGDDELALTAATILAEPPARAARLISFIAIRRLAEIFSHLVRGFSRRGRVSLL